MKSEANQTGKQRPASLLVRILSSSVLLIAVTGVFLGYTGVQLIQDFAKERFDERMQFLARHLALNAELGLLVEQRNALERLADNILAEKGVVRVVIEGGAEPITAEAIDGKKTGLQQVSRFVTTPAMDVENVVFEPGSLTEGLLQENVIGKVTIFYTDQELRALIRSLGLRFAMVAVGICLLGTVFMLFISRSILAPLRKLVVATQRVSGGELNLEVEGGHVRETDDLARSFNTMLHSIRESRAALRESYEELAKQKNMAEVGKFSMVLTHEFKNPLSIVKGSLDILKKPDIPSETRALMITYMQEEVLRIDRLIEEFLLFSKPKKPDMKPCPGDALLGRLAEKFRVRIGSSGPRIEFIPAEEPVYILLDETLFTRALENVIKNGVEVSEESGRVLIRSTVTDGNWKIEISDEGPGIPQEVKELVFEPFYSTKAKGTGLGIPTAANALAAHGGKLEIAENHDGGKGTTFIISLPMTREPKDNGEAHGVDTGRR